MSRWAGWGYDVKGRMPLGSGAFGTVFRATAIKGKPGLEPGCLVAIKELALTDTRGPDALTLRRARSSKAKSDEEGATFLALNQRDEFVKLFDHHRDEKSESASLVFEYCAGGSLAQVLASECKITGADVHKAALRLLRGLRHLRQFKLVHRDLALRNIFLRKEGDFATLVIGDVGMAATSGSDECLTQLDTESASMAPETIARADFT